ncbi:MAG: HD domain-containing protein [Candidatus Paceibacterota bacterium]
MKNIIDIYKEYKIMPNLAVHQFRVAAVAWQICESFNIDVDKDSIVKACLLHDMGNIIKFNLIQTQALFGLSDLEIQDAIIVQNEFIQKYGKSEHEATVLIGRELGVSSYVLELIDCVDSSNLEILAMKDDFNKKICMYADGRVTPHGVVSINERSREAKERYQNHPNKFDEESRLHFNKNLGRMEQQIFSHSKIKPEDINDESIKNYLEKLQNYSI